MRNMHPITLLACVLVAAVGLVQISHLASAPDASQADAAPVDAAAPNATAVETAAVKAEPAQEAKLAAAPNRVPHYLKLSQVPTAQATTAQATIGAPNRVPHYLKLSQAPTAAPRATPNHDQGQPLPVQPLPDLALEQLALRAEPEPAAEAAPASAAHVEPTPAAEAAPSPAAQAEPALAEPDFVDADTTLYAKDSARLRAAPSTKAFVLTKLDADAELRAVGRSTDGKWWRVSLAGGRIGYIHRVAVTKTPMSKTTASAAPMSVAADTPQPSAPARGSQGLRGYVDETLEWFTDTAARGSPPSMIRPER